MRRRTFLRLASAGALALAGCGTGAAAPGQAAPALVPEGSYPLEYARQFSAELYRGG